MLPRVVLHNTVSVDGRLDWFTGDVGLYYELAGRWPAGAVLAGSNTILAAYQQEAAGLEAETEEAPPADLTRDQSRPLLVVPDSRGRVRCWRWLRREPYWRDVVALCAGATPAAHLEYLRQQGVDCIVAGRERVDLRAALAELKARYGVELVRVDSGGLLNGVLLRAGLVDEVSVLINPTLVGGLSPRSLFVAPDLDSEAGVIRLRLVHFEQLSGDTVWLRYEVMR